MFTCDACIKRFAFFFVLRIRVGGVLNQLVTTNHIASVSRCVVVSLPVDGVCSGWSVSCCAHGVVGIVCLVWWTSLSTEESVESPKEVQYGPEAPPSC